MITVEQRPLTLTPSKVEHIYNVSSPNSGNTDFRYVFDVWVDTTTSNPTKIARLINSPNTYGKGIIDVSDIVQNYVQGNARADEPQYTSSATTGNTAYGLISNVKGVANSNAFNDNTNYNKQVHVRDYRVMVGEQWTSGSTTVLNISTGTTTPGSTFYCELVGSDINYYGAGANIVEGSSLEQGITYTGSSISGFTTVDGTIRLSDAYPSPVSGSTIEVEEVYSGIIWTFTYDGEGWVNSGATYPSDYDPALSPPAVTIWPGTALKEGSYNPYVYNAPYWDTTTPDDQQNFWEVKKYRMSGTTVSEIEPSMFLTTAGDELFNINDATPGITTSRARRRKHHPSCPILVSWFNGILSQNTDFYFENPLATIVTASSSTQSGEYGAAYEYPIDGASYTGLTPQNDRILYYNTISPNLAGGKVCFWTAGSEGEYQYDGYGYSEVLEFYLEEDSCLSDPVHVLFMNRQGVWDTYTLDRRALEQKSISRKMYSQGGISDTNVYSQLSTNRRQVIYDQDIVEVMSVDTWFLSDNDKQIVMDLFMSPEVYIIHDHDWTGKAEKTYNPYLLPVTLKTDSITEYKNRYNKLTQYSFNMEYTPINQYNTQG